MAGAPPPPLYPRHSLGRSVAPFLPFQVFFYPSGKDPFYQTMLLDTKAHMAAISPLPSASSQENSS